MRIAMVHTPLVGPSGGERQILELAHRLEKKGHEVTVFTNAVDEEKCYPDLIRKVNVEVVKPPVNVKYLNTYLGMKKIGKVIASRADEFDLINNHNFPSEWAVYYAKKKCNLPAVWMCNEPPFWFFVPSARKGINRLRWPFYEILDKKAVEKIDCIVVLSKMIQKLVYQIYGRGSVIVRSGIDLDKFNLDNVKFEKEDEFMVLMVGTLCEHKNQIALVKMLSIMKRSFRQEYERVKVVLVGPCIPEYRDKLFALANELGVRDKIEYKGIVSDEELLKLYAACDVFVFSAHQSWSLVTVEAMAMGKPVVVSNKCGVSEIINGVNGQVYEHENYGELAEIIVFFMRNERLRELIGKTAREYVRENLSWDAYASRMEKIFENFLL